MSSYYWHGRDVTTTCELNPKTLSAGLDDYPRASHPSEDERHLDLRCWMYLASDCMHSIAELLDKDTKPGKDYSATARLLSDFQILNQMHLDNKYGAYFDFGNHTEKALVDMVESIAGAILLDTKLNLNEVWRIYKPLLSPIVTPDKLELHPFRKLNELCASRGYFIKENFIKKGDMVHAELSLQLKDVLFIGEGYEGGKKLQEEKQLVAY
nr:mannosyl-oligosaccharide glucosidase GCS1-like [Quercus suber]